MAQILERERDALIHDWRALVEKQEDLMAIPLSYQDRTAHLPQLLTDVIARLCLDAWTTASSSLAVGHHGNLRRQRIPWRATEEMNSWCCSHKWGMLKTRCSSLEKF